MPTYQQLKTLLSSRALDDAFARAYTKAQYEKQYERFLKVLEEFRTRFDAAGTKDIGLFSAPGRSEIGGNHTDHNHGKVLAASISLDVVAAAAKNDEGVVRIKSAGYPMDAVSVADLAVRDSDAGRSRALVRGMLDRFVQLGYKVGGFDAATASQVLSGSGLSSSAAFEVLIGTLINELYNDGKVSPVEIAKIAQYAENVHFKKPCGLLDQMACSVGGFVSIDFADPQSPVVGKVAFDFASCNHALCIVDTKGSHSDLTDDYVAVPNEMKQVAAYFGKEVLREVDEKEFYKAIPSLHGKVSDRAILRAMHFFGENSRAIAEADALDRGDLKRFFSLYRQSANSSADLLQNLYSAKKPLEQGIPLALAVSKAILGENAHVRVHGGGFAGTIQAFVPLDKTEAYREKMDALFGAGSCYVLRIRPVGGIKIV